METSSAGTNGRSRRAAEGKDRAIQQSRDSTTTRALRSRHSAVPKGKEGDLGGSFEGDLKPLGEDGGCEIQGLGDEEAEAVGDAVCLLRLSKSVATPLFKRSEG